MPQNTRVLKIPNEVLKICETLARAGESAYVVGGALRDMLADRPLGDFDLATTATPKRVMKLFVRVVPTGIKHGTVTVFEDQGKYEVTTLRGDGPYSDGRHPDSVEFLSSIETDLARRDFTINALAWDPTTETLHDPFNGEADIANRTIRAVGDPKARFGEDGLRVLRAARFAATLGFEIEQKTLEAMPLAAPALARVSKERIRDEMEKLLLSERPSHGLEVMEEAGLMGFVCPELSNLKEMEPWPGRALNPWCHTLARVDAIEPELGLRLAAVLFDSGLKHATLESAQESARLATMWLKEMRFGKKTVDVVPHLILCTEFGLEETLSDADVRRFVKGAGRDNVLGVVKLKRADLKGYASPESARQTLDTLDEQVRTVLDSDVPLYSNELAIDGDDLMNDLSIPPGPKIGHLLEELVELVIENPKSNQRDKLLARAKELV